MPRIPSRFLDLSSDFDFSGRVIVPTPSGAGQMANKAYFDTTYQGSQGFTGARGFQGTIGSNGSAGPQGLSGSNGTNGFQGTAGSNGANGFQGPLGSNGSNGVQGFAGFQGNRGFQGIVGSGVQGANGFQGTAVVGSTLGSIPQVLCTTGTANVTVTASVTNTETTLLGTTTFGTKTIPANLLRAGKIIRVTLNGLFSATSSSSYPLFRIRVKLGSTAILDTGDLSHDANAISYPDPVDTVFNQELLFLVRSAGASGSIAGHNKIDINYGGSPFSYTVSNIATIDTTTTQVIDVTMQWTGTDTNNAITIKAALVEII